MLAWQAQKSPIWARLQGAVHLPTLLNTYYPFSGSSAHWPKHMIYLTGNSLFTMVEDKSSLAQKIFLLIFNSAYLLRP